MKLRLLMSLTFLHTLGKSLFVARLREDLEKKYQRKNEDVENKCPAVTWHSSVIRFLDKNVDVADAINIMTRYEGKDVANSDLHFVHVDITPAVSAKTYFTRT